MTTALLPRPDGRWRICNAFAGALLLHLAAVALAAREPQPPTTVLSDDWPEIEIIDPAPEITRLEQEEEIPPAPSPPPTDNPVFLDQTPPQPKQNERTAKPLVRLVHQNFAASPRVASGRALALNAPRPEYPYEARRQRLTGSGVALLTVDTATGAVLDVAMTESTGSAVLDQAAISGFRRWRFKPGTAAKVQTPITFTLTGAAY